MKISNELLSAVLGCECEFKNIYKNKIEFTSCGISYKDDNIYINPINYNWEINLDTFIRLGKVEIFKHGYYLHINGCVDVLHNEINLRDLPSFEGECNFSQEAELKALEWVNNEVEDG